MPESAKDRCTKAHEYLFLLTKRPQYYYDSDAIKEPVSGSAHARGSGVNPKARVPTGWDTGPGSHTDLKGRYPKPKQNESFSSSVNELVDYRNKRSVWSIITQAYKDAHFATFPEALVRPCVMAGCPEGGTVLDPFAGSGTTGMVANALGRNAIMIELKPEYIDMIKSRTQQTSML